MVTTWATNCRQDVNNELWTVAMGRIYVATDDTLAIFAIGVLHNPDTLAPPFTQSSQCVVLYDWVLVTLESLVPV